MKTERSNRSIAERLEEAKDNAPIVKLKRNLMRTDYKTLKRIEGHYTDEQWAEIKAKRQAWRDELNVLQEAFDEKWNKET